MKLSKSKVNTYLKCPLEFKFQYIDEIEVPENKYMALGSDVHLIAEKFSEKFEDDLDDVSSPEGRRRKDSNIILEDKK